MCNCSWICESGRGFKKNGTVATGLSAVGGDFGREVLDAASAAALAQDVAVQRVTASTLAFRGQQETTFLTDRDTSVSSCTSVTNPADLWHFKQL